MKFQQRVVMVSSTACFTVVYLLLAYHQGVVQVWNVNPGRYRRSLLIDYDFDQKYWNPTLKPNDCTFSDSSLDALYNNKTISTLDLPQKTNYKVYSNKQYSLPHPHVNDSDTDVEPLTVVVLPHSHVDAGWLQTVEEYYVSHVKAILNNMVRKLNKYASMRFVWAETVFLSMWWNELDDDIKFQVRRLIHKGQLEIALGGWVMSDEASTTYSSVIDQLVEGHQWVWENLHTRPVNSWAIDPFGHSGTMPYLYKQAGITNMVIQRVHQAIKATLAGQKALEFNWRQYWDKSGSSDVLCHIMPYVFYGAHYTCGPDKQVCALYDYGTTKLRTGEEKSTGRIITDENVAKLASYLYRQYRLKSGLFRYNTILVPVGDDFRYDQASEWDLQYQNYGKLMDYINSRREWKTTVKFGTLQDYFNIIRQNEKKKSVHDSEMKFPTLSGDFFPYSDQNTEYWTGFYSTRPFDKQLSRDVEANLRAADILNMLAYAACKRWSVEYQSYHEVATSLQDARRNLGLFLHHDAITGTAKPHVVQDYETKLLAAYNATQLVIRTSIQTLLSKGKLDGPNVLSLETIRQNTINPPFRYTVKMKDRGTTVILFNPVAQERTEFVRLVVDSANIEIKNSENEAIPFQINPVFKSATKVHDSEFEIVFLAELKALSIETYTLYKVSHTTTGYWSSITTYNSASFELPHSHTFPYKHHNFGSHSSDIIIENEYIKAEFEAKRGMLQKVIDLYLNKVTKVEMKFMAYKSEGSGAYLFYPSGSATDILASIPGIRVVKGAYLEEVQVVYEHLSHRITLYNTPTVQGLGLHVENKLDMNIYDMKNNEVIMRVVTDVENKDGYFYTDQNGYQLIGRKNNAERRVETNYYPVTSMVLLEDDGKRLTLHSGQSHGAACLEQGWLEVMLDRQILTDDHRGLGEGVWDNKLTVSNFIIQIEHKDSVIPNNQFKFTNPSVVSIVQTMMLQQPLVTLFTPVHNFVNLNFQPVAQALPCDVSIVSLKNLIDSDLIYNGTSLIIHRKGYKCDFPVTGLQCSLTGGAVNLKSLLAHIAVGSARETTLTHLYTKGRVSLDTDIQMEPMEIKSFLLQI